MSFYFYFLVFYFYFLTIIFSSLFSAEPGRPIQMCPFCEGTGGEVFEGLDGLAARSTCRFCDGKGHNVVHKCTHCMGYGRVLVDRDLVLPVPPGVADGETIKVNIAPTDDDKRISGLYESHDAPVQHVFVTFRVEPSRYFTVDEDNGVDLHSSAPISLAQAVFGGTVKVDGLYADEEVEFGSFGGGGDHGDDQDGVIRLVAKGLKKVTDAGYGDHYVHLKIQVPR